MNLNIWVYSVIVQRQSGRHCQHNLALDYCAILFHIQCYRNEVEIFSA